MAVFEGDLITIELDPNEHFDMVPYSRIMEVIGIIPNWLAAEQALPADQAIHVNYAHGGGWYRVNGFTIDPATGVLTYPEDPDMYPLAKFTRKAWPNEIVYQYEYGYVAVFNTETYELNIARID